MVRSGIDATLSSAMSFAWEVGHYLTTDGRWSRCRVAEGESSALALNGTVLVSGRKSRFEFIIADTWHIRPPLVTCREPWVRIKTDWHVYRNNALCWVYGPLWRDLISDLGKRFEPAFVVKFAAYMCIEHSVRLAGLHLLADEEQIVSWPREWDEWKHDSAIAVRDYSSMKRNGQYEGMIQNLLAAIAANNSTEAVAVVT